MGPSGLEIHDTALSDGTELLSKNDIRILLALKQPDY